MVGLTIVLAMHLYAVAYAFHISPICGDSRIWTVGVLMTWAALGSALVLLLADTLKVSSGRYSRALEALALAFILSAGGIFIQALPAAYTLGWPDTYLGFGLSFLICLPFSFVAVILHPAGRPYVRGTGAILYVLRIVLSWILLVLMIGFFCIIPAIHF